MHNENYYTYFNAPVSADRMFLTKYATYGLQTQYPNRIKADNVVSTIKKTIATEYKYIKKTDDTLYRWLNVQSRQKSFRAPY